MSRPALLLLGPALLAIVVAAAPDPATAAWPGDPLVNVPLCTATGVKYTPTSIPDGTGGAIVTWSDARDGAEDIYAQRISADGTIQWVADGVALCAATYEQRYPTIASDGAGGAIVTWQDYRSGAGYDLYAQRVSSTGAVQWATNGVALCTAAGDQQSPTVVSNGVGGAIVTWQDSRSGSGNDIYAQQISAAGAVQWTANGVALCGAASSQSNPAIAPDGANGAIISWYDARSGTGDIYAQRVSAVGAVQWTADGVALCTATGTQYSPVIVTDGAAGAIVAWYDARTGGSNYDIYAQRVSATGTVQWTADGVALCTADNTQFRAKISPDGAGGAIVTWSDRRSGSQYDIYAQRITAAGAVQWATDGVALCTADGDQQYPAIVPDGASGAIVSWYDPRGGAYDIYAQRISAGGAVQWTADGVALSTAAGSQYEHTVVSDGADGAIVSWRDTRNGGYDIYAQRVTRFGVLGAEPLMAGVRDIPNDQGGKVKVSWYSSCLDAAPDYGIGAYWIWRSVPPNYAALALSRGAGLLAADESGPPPTGATIQAEVRAGQTIFWEYVGSQVAAADDGYSFVVPTTSDSLAASNPYTLIRVQARASAGGAFWNSATDSGYSVDNLAPAPPAAFTGQYAAGTATLHWAASPAADLGEYRLYRGSSADFVPGPGNLIAARPDTGYVDAAGAAFYYKLCAVDVHGNVSGFSTLLPAGTLDAPGAAPPRAAFLAPPSPNPTRGTAVLRFGLPRAAVVELTLHDPQGRGVRSLVDGARPAGEHTIRWDGLDAAGHPLPAGLYFARLVVGRRTLTARLVLVR